SDHFRPGSGGPARPAAATGQQRSAAYQRANVSPGAAGRGGPARGIYRPVRPPKDRDGNKALARRTVGVAVALQRLHTAQGGIDRFRLLLRQAKLAEADAIKSFDDLQWQVGDRFVRPREGRQLVA